MLRFITLFLFCISCGSCSTKVALPDIILYQKQVKPVIKKWQRLVQEINSSLTSPATADTEQAKLFHRKIKYYYMPKLLSVQSALEQLETVPRLQRMTELFIKANKVQTACCRKLMRYYKKDSNKQNSYFKKAAADNKRAQEFFSAYKKEIAGLP
ncbi:MAG TPA: hypothetical protein VKS21_08770 [Spirochaetota bacterium]|nr:hypothetical protein [Spirochaetota bacterium]